MAEMRVTIEGSYNPATGQVTTTIPVSGTFTPSGTQDVNVVSPNPVPVSDAGGSLTVDGSVTALPATSAAANTITAASGLTTGTVYDLGRLSRDYTFVITSSATLTAGVIRLFGSIDNTSFVQIGTDITASTDFPSATSKAYGGATDYRYFRADITTAITGGTITAKILGA